MKYQYTYRTTASELWQLSMYYIYGSMVGLCNILFTAAVIALMVSRWQTAPTWQRLLFVAALCLFTVLQPLAIYRRARRQAARIQADTTLGANEAGIHIQVGDQRADLKWSSIKRVSKKPTMLILFSDTSHGYVLSNRVLGGERDEFYAYAASRAGRGRS